MLCMRILYDVIETLLFKFTVCFENNCIFTAHGRLVIVLPSVHAEHQRRYVNERLLNELDGSFEQIR